MQNEELISMVDIRNAVGVDGAPMLSEMAETIRRLKTGHDRYEKLRKLSPQQFMHLYYDNVAGEGAFDELVDKLI